MLYGVDVGSFLFCESKSKKIPGINCAHGFTRENIGMIV